MEMKGVLNMSISTYYYVRCKIHPFCGLVIVELLHPDCLYAGVLRVTRRCWLLDVLTMVFLSQSLNCTCSCMQANIGRGLGIAHADTRVLICLLTVC